MATSLEPAVQGIVVPGYRVEERIGSGGFGEVFRAKHEVIGREVAIKVLHAQYAASSEAVARFIAEARAVNQISHPGIVEIFDFGVLPSGREYVVMELLRGETLREVLRREIRLGLDAALPILAKIAEAVDAAHAVGIAHRDLKPDNVFVLSDGRVKLIDFGLAKLQREGAPTTETGSVFGTPIYMSPEQCRGKASDLRTDMYSFGVLAYHVLVGEPPFAGSALEIALHHLNDRPQPPCARVRELPARVDTVLLGLMAKDPTARPRTLAAAIAQLEGEAPPPRAAVASTPSRRGVIVALVGGAVGGAAVMALVGATGSTAPEPVAAPAPASTPAVAATKPAAGCATCALWAISPPFARAGDAIILEGTFGANTTATFPGGWDVVPTRLGDHRLQALVPFNAIDGNIIVHSEGRDLTARFRRIPSAMGLSRFERADPQTHGARALPHLAIPRYVAAAVATKDFVYVIGGFGAGYRASVERAPIEADGSLGRFAEIAQLTRARASCGAIVLRDRLYVAGGDVGNGAIASIEAADIHKDGSLGPFAVVPAKISPMGNPYLFVLGERLYAAGNTDRGRVVEYATIAPDGTLSDFAPGPVLDGKPRYATPILVGEFLYMIAGAEVGTNQPTTGISRAILDRKGELGPFEPLPNAAFAKPHGGVNPVAIGNAVYLIGGPSDGSERAMFGDTPTAFEPMPELALTEERGGPVMLVVGSTLYVLGGRYIRDDLDSIERASIVASGGFDTFGQVTTTSAARSHHASVVVGRGVYDLGGDGGGFPIASVERSAIASWGWPDAFQPQPDRALPGPRANATVATIGDAVFVIGGRDKAGALASIARAPIEANRTLGAFALAEVSLAVARSDATAVVLDDALFVIGGRGRDGAALASIERATINRDGSLGPFAVIATKLPAPRAEHRAAVIGRAIYLVGGVTTADAPAREVMRIAFDRSTLGSNEHTALGAIATTTPLLAPRRGHAIEVIGDALYVIGGALDAAAPAVERATIAPDGSLEPFAPSRDHAFDARRAGHTTMTFGNYAFAIGGTQGSGTARRATVDGADLK